MRPIQRVRLQMIVPPTMDEDQQRHKETSELDSLANTKITASVQLRDASCRASSEVEKPLFSCREHWVDHMETEEPRAPPPPQHRTQRSECALQQLESTRRACTPRLTLPPPPHDCTKRKQCTSHQLESCRQSRHVMPQATALNHT